jgi:hypothetical protein
VKKSKSPSPGPRDVCFKALALCVLVLVGAAFLPAATIEVTTTSDRVNPGESFDITVSISGLGDGAPPSPGTFDMTLVFDSAVFELDPLSVVTTTLLGDPGLAEAIVTVNPGTADLNVLAISLLPAAQLTAMQPGAFELFTATFTNVGFGAGVFDVPAPLVLGDKNGAPIPVDAVIPVQVIGGTILEIPTAGGVGLTAMVLLLLGAGLVVLRRMS